MFDYLDIDEFAKSALLHIIVANPTESDFIKSQIENIEISSIEYTAVGMMINFKHLGKTFLRKDVVLNGVLANSSDSDLKIVSLLFIRNGALQFLENCTSHGIWPKDITGYEFRIVKPY